MPNKEYYINQAEADGPSHFALLKSISNSKVLTSGWATFAVKSFSVAMGSATVFSLSCLMAFAPYFGPVMPFLVGATGGFAGGMIHRWVFDKNEALHALQTYPDVMAHHMTLLGPSTWEGVDFDEWRKDAHRSVYKQSVAIAALYSASDLLERIAKEKEEMLFRKYTAEYQD